MRFKVNSDGSVRLGWSGLTVWLSWEMRVDGMQLPWYYGRVYRDLDRDALKYAVLPLNYILAVGRWVMHHLRVTGPYRMGVDAWVLDCEIWQEVHRMEKAFQCCFWRNIDGSDCCAVERCGLREPVREDSEPSYPR